MQEIYRQHCPEQGRGQIEAAGLQPRDEEQIVDEPQQTVGAPRDDLEVAATLRVERRLDVVVEDELDVAHDRGERCSQIVGDQRDELVLQAVGLDELGADALERAEDADETHDDEHRDRRACGGDRPDLERRVADGLNRQDRRRGQQRRDEERDPGRADMQQAGRPAWLREDAHRRMECRRCPEHVREEPPEVDPVT